MDNGIYSNLQRWTASPHINAGPNKLNTLAVLAKDNNFTLYANDNRIFELVDGTHNSGFFGLMIRSDITYDFKVFVDEISYWTKLN